MNNVYQTNHLVELSVTYGLATMHRAYWRAVRHLTRTSWQQGGHWSGSVLILA